MQVVEVAHFMVCRRPRHTAGTPGFCTDEYMRLSYQLDDMHKKQARKREWPEWDWPAIDAAMSERGWVLGVPGGVPERT